MHMELQVALNFLVSFLYNKLPRRRVNQFAEELEKVLVIKFKGHWYPERPFKGSAFRCLKTSAPLDPVFELAARECGMDLQDIQDNLPHELSIWIDPGEVSYRLGETGPVKILYSESENNEERTDREVTKTFNPEAQCFRPIDSVASQLGAIHIEAPNGGSSLPCACGCGGTERCLNGGASPNITSPFASSNSPSPPTSFKNSASPVFLNNKSTQPLTFTTAAFAQTKFGSTKLKTNSKRSQRMSPTEFSNYIKQRALAQQVAQQQLAAQQAQLFDRPRSLSPHPDSNMLLFAPPHSPHFAMGSMGPQAPVFDSATGYASNSFGGEAASVFGNSLSPNLNSAKSPRSRFQSLFNNSSQLHNGSSDLAMPNLVEARKAVVSPAFVEAAYGANMAAYAGNNGQQHQQLLVAN